MVYCYKQSAAPQLRLPEEGGETENLAGPACLKQEKGKIALAPPGWVSQRGKLGQGRAQGYLASQWRARNKTAQLQILCSSCQETILLCPKASSVRGQDMPLTIQVLMLTLDVQSGIKECDSLVNILVIILKMYFNKLNSPLA